MTNQERITSHNALIDQAIAKANALPDAGSGGGASIETCTVTINANGANITNCAATVYENGDFTVVYTTNLDIIPEKTINNVVCGSFIVFSFDASGGIQVSGSERLYGSTYKITATAGETATITFIPF